MQQTLALPLPPEIPTYLETIALLGSIPSTIYRGLEHANAKDRTYLELESPDETDPFFSAPMVRFHLRKFLRRAGIDAKEDKYSWTLDRVANIGISFMYARMSIKILKGKGGVLPGCGVSSRKRKFYNQVQTLHLDESRKTYSSTLNLIVLWDDKSRLWLACPATGAAHPKNVRAYWIEPLSHPLESTGLVPPQPPPNDDLGGLIDYVDTEKRDRKANDR